MKFFNQEQLYGKKITIADRYMVESEAEKFLDPAKDKNVAFLVVGDPFGYEHTPFFRTCHTNIHQKNVPHGQTA